MLIREYWVLLKARTLESTLLLILLYITLAFNGIQHIGTA